MPKIKNKRYLQHFKKRKIDLISPKEFYEKLNNIKARPHLQNLLKDFFLLLYWTGRRPVEILELKGEDFHTRLLKEKEESEKQGKEIFKEYLTIDTHTKKGGNEVEIHLLFENIPGLKKFWERIEGVPKDFEIFSLLISRNGQYISWKTKQKEFILDGKPALIPSKNRKKYYEEKCKRVYYWCNKYFGVPPYFFRHNRFSSMKINGASFEDIKTFKGAKSMASVEPYISPDEETLRGLGRGLFYNPQDNN